MKCWQFLLYLLLNATCSFSNDETVLPAIKQITTQNGLADNRVKYMFQDQQGFVWLNTRNGLQRYDGNQFFTLTYDPDQPLQSLPSAIMNFGIMEDRQHRIWAVTEHEGPVSFDPSSGKLTRFNTQVQHRNQLRTHTILQTSKTAIYVSAATGLLKLSKGQFLPVEDKSFPWKKEQLTRLRNIMEDESGKLWIASPEGFVLMDHGEKFYTKDRNPEGLKILQSAWDVSSSLLDQDNCIWFSSWKLSDKSNRFLFRYDIVKNLLDSVPLPSQPGKDDYFSIPSSMVQDNAGNIWIATLGGRLLVYNSAMQLLQQYSAIAWNGHAIQLESIAALFCDRQGNIWVSMEQGLFICSAEEMIGKHQLSMLQFPFSFQHAATRLFVSPPGNIYVNSLSKGLFRWNLQENKLEEQPQQIHSGKWAKHLNILYADSHRIFVNPWFTDEVIVYNENDKTFQPFIPEGKLRQYTINAIGTSSSLMFTGKDALQIYTFDGTWQDSIRLGNQPPILTDWIRIKDDIIIAIDTASGIYKINPSTKQVDQLAIINLRGENFCISATASGYLIGTYYEGLKLVDSCGKVIRAISTKDGLLSNTILRLFRDSSGRTWIKTPNGFNFIDDYRQLQVYTSAQLDKRYNAFQDAYPDNRYGFVFLTRQQLNYIPYLTLTPPDAVPFVFTSLKAGPEVLASGVPARGARIPWHHNPVSLSFAALDFTQNSSLQYRYKLEPIQQDWTYTGSSGQVVFHQLAPGDYQFTAEYRNLNGNWMQNGLSYSFTITRPLWKRWWVYGILFLLLLVPLIYSRRKDKLARKKIETLRWQLARDLHDDIGSTLSSIGVYSAVLDTRIQDEKGRFVLQQIKDRTKEMVRNMADIVWAIQPDQQENDILPERFKQYAQPILQLAGIELIIKTAADCKWKLSMLEKRNIFLVLKEALTNTLKYSGANRVELVCSMLKQQLLIEFSDNGIGFNRTELKRQNGLLNMEKRMNEINARLEIESAAGSGTCLRLILRHA